MTQMKNRVWIVNTCTHIFFLKFVFASGQNYSNHDNGCPTKCGSPTSKYYFRYLLCFFYETFYQHNDNTFENAYLVMYT